MVERQPPSYHIPDHVQLCSLWKRDPVFMISKPLGWELLGKESVEFEWNFSYRIFLEILWSCHLKEKEKQRQAELQEKKEIAERKFKEWLENAKNKPRPAAKSYGYANGKLTGFYSGNSYPEPAFYNPVPWKPIPMPPPKEAKALSGKKTKRPVISQPQRSSSLVTHKDRSTLCLGTLCRIQR